MAGEKYLAATPWFVDWEWANRNGEKGLPYDFVKGELWADCKVSSHADHLMVGEKWLKKRIAEGRTEIAVVAVHWDRRLRVGMEFRALGWTTSGRLAREGVVYRKDFRFLHVSSLQPMRTLPT